MSSIIKQLVSGYLAFKKQHFELKNTYEKLVSEGQSPKVLFIACCDSRVDPAILLGCSPGDLFVVRNVANLVPQYESDAAHHGTSAAIEFAVKSLKVTDIIIMGHSQCGGIHALMQDQSQAEETDFIAHWMGIATQAKAEVLANSLGSNLEQQCYAAEKRSVLISRQNLLTFPWVKERIDAGELDTHAWYFDMGQGAILAADAQGYFDALEHADFDKL